MKFSFDETAGSEIRTFFEEALDSVGQETGNLFTGLVDVYSREQYKPLYEMTYEIGEYYIGDFRNEVQNQFDNWLDSDTSLRAFAQDLEASADSSDDAFLAAQRIETDLQNALDEFFSHQPDTPAVSTEAHLTKELDEVFDEVDEMIQKYEDGIEDLISDYDAKVDSNSDENQLYENVGEILGAILESFKSLFNVFKEGVSNLAGHLNDRGATAKDKSETDNAQMRNVAEASGDALRDVSGLFDFE